MIRKCMRDIRIILCSAGLAALLLLSGPALACQIPVFRYAIWRWSAGNYRVMLFHRGVLNPQQRAWADGLKKACEQEDVPVNAVFEDVDLTDANAGRTAEIWDALKLKEPLLPAVVALYPGSEQLESVPQERWQGLRSAWAETLSAGSANAILHSPLRSQIAHDLIEAKAAVFVLVKSGDARKDQQAQTTLRTLLTKMEGELQMPTADPTIPWPENLHGLKIAFSVRTVDAKDPAEAAFLAMALTLSPGINQQLAAGHPAIIPLYGRGRALPPYLADDKDLEAITASVGGLVAGACSCELKELNPGVDMLVATNWDRALQTFAEARADATTEPATPPAPPSLAQLAQTASQPATATAPMGGTEVRPTLAAEGGGIMARNLALLAGAATGAVVALSAWRLWRRRRRA